MQKLHKAVEDAKKWEVYARDFYLKAAKAATDKTLRKLFLKLADQEEKHRQIIESMDPDNPMESIQEIPWVKVLEDMDTKNPETLKKQDETLRFAIDKEKKAKEKYYLMAAETKNSKLKQLFTALAIAESGHQQFLEVEKQRLNRKYSG